MTIPRSSWLPRSTKPIARSPVKKRRGKPRRQANVDPAYREWIRSLPCALLLHSDIPHDCAGPIECCHVRTKRLGGDRANCLPLCARSHRVQHQRGIKTFAAFYGVDLKLLAEAYDAVYSRTWEPA